MRETGEPLVEELKSELAVVRDELVGMGEGVDRDRLLALEKSITDTITKAEEKMEGANTNGDIVLTVAGIAGTAFGIPYVPTITTLLRHKREKATIVRNIDLAKSNQEDDRPTIDIGELRKLNVLSGVNEVVRAIRKPA